MRMLPHVGFVLTTHDPSSHRAVVAQEQAPFQGFRTFRCEFLEGEGRAVLDGKTSDRRGDLFQEPLMLDNVDFAKRSARLVGNAGGSDLTILRDGPLAVTFAEYTAPGGVSVLTIFKHAAGFDGHHRAVWSRHLPFSSPEGSLSTTQYYGTCRGVS